MAKDDHGVLLKVLSHQRIPYSILSKDLRPSHQESGTREKRDGRSSRLDLETLVDPCFEQERARTGSGSSLIWGRDSNNESDQWSMLDHTTEANTTEDEQFANVWLDSYDQGLTALPQDFWDMGQAEGGNLQCQTMPGSVEARVMGSLPFDSTELDHSPIQSENVQSEGAQSETEIREALVDQLSERIGSLHIGPGRHIRYYGPTSNFSLVKIPPADFGTAHQSIRNDGQDYLEPLNLGKPIPPALEEHLMGLYFSWQDPALHVVNRDMFESARARWRNKEDSPYYSESLQNAMHVEPGNQGLGHRLSMLTGSQVCTRRCF